MTNFIHNLKVKVFLIILLCLSANFAAPGQTTASLDEKKNNKAEAAQSEIYIFLNPFEKRDSIEIEDSCLILLRDVPTKMQFGLGKPLKTSLLAGTAYFVPKGKYEVENSNGFVVEYLLLPKNNCEQEISYSKQL